MSTDIQDDERIENEDPEVETPPEPQDVEGTPEPEETPLILGKFKSQDDLVKAYQEAERAMTAAKEEAARSAQLTNWVAEHEDDFAEYLTNRQNPPKDEPPKSDMPHYDPAWETMSNDDMTPADRAGVAKYNRWLLSRTREIASDPKLRELLSDPQAYVQSLIEPVVGDLKKAQQQTAQERQLETYWSAVETAVAPYAAELFKAGKGSARELTLDTASDFGTKVLEQIQAVMPAFQANPKATMDMVIKAVRADMPSPNPTKKPQKAGTKQAGVAALPPDTFDLEAEAAKLLEKGHSGSEVKAILLKKLGASEDE